MVGGQYFQEGTPDNFFWEDEKLNNHSIKRNYTKYILKGSLCTKELIMCIEITH